MQVKVDSEMEDALIANVKAKLRHLELVAPHGIYGSWFNDLVKDVNDAFDKVANKAASDNAGCL